MVKEIQTSLESLLKAQIERDGPMPLSEFMALASFHPEFGYYTSLKSIGRGGDFVTAPEISQMFGEMLGIWVVSVWNTLGQPARFCLAELGPGQGTLIVDALRAIRQTAPSCFAALQLYLLEASPTLRTKQQNILHTSGMAELLRAELLREELLNDHKATQWVQKAEDLPEDMPLIAIANEFFDALPIEQHIYQNETWRQRCIGLSNEELCFVEGDIAPEALRNELPQLFAPKEGDIFETRPDARAIMKDVSVRLGKQGGSVAIIDYGHDRSAYGSSLQAVSQHAFVPVLSDPGLCDLTAHVDFEALACAAIHHCGALPAQLFSQRAFLKGLGIETRADQLAKKSAEKFKASQASDLRRDTASDASLNNEYKSNTGSKDRTVKIKADIKADLNRLIGEAEMGVLFKALILGPVGSDAKRFDSAPLHT